MRFASGFCPCAAASLAVCPDVVCTIREAQMAPRDAPSVARSFRGQEPRIGEWSATMLYHEVYFAKLDQHASRGSG